jgi:hypothetical protein
LRRCVTRRARSPTCAPLGATVGPMLSVLVSMAEEGSRDELLVVDVMLPV